MNPLELFFDVVFVLALTQCTALMANQATWPGLVKGEGCKWRVTPVSSADARLA